MSGLGLRLGFIDWARVDMIVKPSGVLGPDVSSG